MEPIDDGHPCKLANLANLAISLQLRHEHVGEIEDLESSILNLQKVMDLTPDSHPDLSMYLSNLCPAKVL